MFNTLEWLNANAHRNYPFRDDLVVKDTFGTLLPSEFILDIAIYGTPLGGSFMNDWTERFFVSSIEVAGSEAVITVSFYVNNGEAYEVFRTGAVSLNHTLNDSVADRTYTLNTYGVDKLPESLMDLASFSGVIVVGPGSSITKSGMISFLQQNSRIMPVCVSQNPYGISSLSVNGRIYSGDIVLDFGDGLTAEQQEDGSILVKRTTADSLDTVESLLNEVYRRLGNPILSINEAVPDETGNIAIKGLDCVDIKGGDGFISISNPCSKPCCGNSTPADVLSALGLAEDARARLLIYFENLSNNVNAIQARLSSLIASRS